MLEIRERDDKISVIDFIQYEYYEDIEIMADILSKKLGAEFIKKLDGPDCRVWIFLIDGLKFTLQNDWGCSIFAKSEASKLKLKELLPKLNEVFGEQSKS